MLKEMIKSILLLCLSISNACIFNRCVFDALVTVKGIKEIKINEEISVFTNDRDVERFCTGYNRIEKCIENVGLLETPKRTRRLREIIEDKLRYKIYTTVDNRTVINGPSHDTENSSDLDLVQLVMHISQLMQDNRTITIFKHENETISIIQITFEKIKKSSSCEDNTACIDNSEDFIQNKKIEDIMFVEDNLIPYFEIKTKIKRQVSEKTTEEASGMTDITTITTTTKSTTPTSIAPTIKTKTIQTTMSAATQTRRTGGGFWDALAAALRAALAALKAAVAAAAAAAAAAASAAAGPFGPGGPMGPGEVNKIASSQPFKTMITTFPSSVAPSKTMSTRTTSLDEILSELTSLPSDIASEVEKLKEEESRRCNKKSYEKTSTLEPEPSSSTRKTSTDTTTTSSYCLLEYNQDRLKRAIPRTIRFPCPCERLTGMYSINEDEFLFTVYNSASMPNGSVQEVVAYQSVYSRKKRTPLFTSYVYDDINYRVKGIKKEQKFKKFQTCCDSEQLNVPEHDEYNNRGFDRGHLMPYSAWYNKNEQDTQDTVNYFINAAPQIPYFNQANWKQLESSINCKLKNSLFGGVVVTGVSLLSRSSFNNIAVPEYFWKLVCYYDATLGKVIVFGNIGENDDIEQLDDVLHMYPQREMNRRVDVIRSYGDTFWDMVFLTITSNGRRAAGGLTADICRNSFNGDLPSGFDRKKVKRRDIVDDEACPIVRIERRLPCIDNRNCKCKEGWKGIENNCELDINECESSPCKNEGKCHNMPGSYYCTCKVGYTGVDCETRTNRIDPKTKKELDCSKDGGFQKIENNLQKMKKNLQEINEKGNKFDDKNLVKIYEFLNLTNEIKNEAEQISQRFKYISEFQAVIKCNQFPPPCHNLTTTSSCENTEDGFRCNCVNGWSGPNCEVFLTPTTTTTNSPISELIKTTATTFPTIPTATTTTTASTTTTFTTTTTATTTTTTTATTTNTATTTTITATTTNPCKGEANCDCDRIDYTPFYIDY